MTVEKQDEVRVRYKQIEFTEVLKYDVLVNRCLLVEVKAVQEVHPVHKAQLLSYMKLLDVPLGLIINFHELKVVDGLSRMILRGAGPEGAEGSNKKN
jgi:GxxExxY protein